MNSFYFDKMHRLYNQNKSCVKSCQKHCFLKNNNIVFPKNPLFSQKTHSFPTCALLYPIVLKRKIITGFNRCPLVRMCQLSIDPEFLSKHVFVIIRFSATNWQKWCCCECKRLSICAALHYHQESLDIPAYYHMIMIANYGDAVFYKCCKGNVFHVW